MANKRKFSWNQGLIKSKDKIFYWIYILYCDNDTYYTGYTTDLRRRYREHLLGSRKCKYTRSFKPLHIAQYWQTTEKTNAMKIEKYIKQLPREKKLELISQPSILRQIFPCDVVSKRIDDDLTKC